MHFAYQSFTSFLPFTSSSASSSAASSASSSPASSQPSTPRLQPTSYHATSPYQSSTAASPISITSPCAYPSWPTRPTLQTPHHGTAEHAPYAHTAASSYLSDEDLSPLDSDDELAASLAAAPAPADRARALLDTRAIREALLEEGARKKAQARRARVARRRGSGESERRVKLSPIVEGSFGG